MSILLVLGPEKFIILVPETQQIVPHSEKFALLVPETQQQVPNPEKSTVMVPETQQIVHDLEKFVLLVPETQQPVPSLEKFLLLMVFVLSLVSVSQAGGKLAFKISKNIFLHFRLPHKDEY